MSTFSFGKINTSSNKQVLNLRLNSEAMLVDRSNIYASYTNTPIVLVDEIYEEFALKGIESFLKTAGLSKYIILSAVNCQVNDRILAKEGKIAFYKRNRSNFEKYLLEGSPIITVGSALYSLLLEDDIYPSHVQQIIFGKPNFLFSKDLTRENCHRIFPIESFREIFATGFQKPVDSYKTKLAQIQISNCIRLGDNPIPRYPKLNKIFIHNLQEFNDVFYTPNKDKRNEMLAWDLETSGLNFLKDEIGCITLSFDGVTGYYIPWRIMREDNSCYPKLDEILGNNFQLGANLKFDYKFLKREGFKNVRIDEDIIQMGHTLDETRGNSLKALAFYYSEFGGYERSLDAIKERLGKGRDINYIKDIPEETLWDYAVMDAIVTRRVWANMLAHMRELDKKYPNEFCKYNGMEQYYYNRRIPACNMYADIEYTGCYVDKQRLDDLRNEMESYLANLKKELSQEFKISLDFDWGSSQQLGKLLESMGWEDLGRSKTGVYLTADFQLERWKKVHPIVSKIQEMRSIATLLHSFVGDSGKGSVFSDFIRDNTEKQYLEDDGEGEQGWSQYLTYHPEDKSWRMHATCGVHMNTTGRNRMSSPNLQNTPTHSEWASKIKRCIITPNNDEYYLVTVDYQNLQMRLACIDCADKNLTTLFNQPNADPHSMTGWLTFCANKEMDIDIVSVKKNDGSIVEYLGGEFVFTQDRGNVFARDLTEADGVISKRTEHRLITEKEFQKQKGSQPYKNLRSAAKGPNFLLIFGGSQKILSNNALETTWDEAQVDEYLKDNNCDFELEETHKIYKNEDPVTQKYIAAAARIRTNFFKGYPGLLERCDREVAYGETHGYCRSVFGQTRNCIELMLKGDYDEKVRSGALRSESNKMKNVRMQNYESCIRGRAMYDTQKWLISSGRKSREWNDIHDSCDIYLYKTELHDVLAHMKHVFERRIPELKDTWVPLNIDVEIADISDTNHHDYYKGGREPDEFGIDNWDQLQFEDPDPWNVELYDEAEKDYFKKRAVYWKEVGKEDPQADQIEKYLTKK